MSAQIMQNIGLAHVPASQASIIMCTESLFAVTFSALFWGETIMWSSLVGFALIFVAVLMSVIKPTKQSLHRNCRFSFGHGWSWVLHCPEPLR